jgi:hypothetical protein
LVPRLGLEPNNPTNKDGPELTHTHKYTHKDPATAHKEFARVLAAWPKLSKSIKAAIIALVDSSLAEGQVGE